MGNSTSKTLAEIQTADLDENGNLTFRKSDKNVIGPFKVKGEPGVGISSAEINSEGVLNISLTDGRSVNYMVKGRDGIDGRPGKDGIDGRPGKDGVDGRPGKDGIPGPMGASGSIGRTGLTGERGLQGIQGVQGIQGEIGPIGLQGLQGLQGTPGLKGIQGDIGPIGLQGLQGLQGPIGLQGIQGIKGDRGATGERGLQGIQGIKGDVGATGERGLQGIQGIQGIKGDVGPIGPKGGLVDGSDINVNILRLGNWRVQQHSNGNLHLYQNNIDDWAMALTTDKNIFVSGRNILGELNNLNNRKGFTNSSGSIIQLQDDGNFVFYNKNRSPTWSTNTRN